MQYGGTRVKGAKHFRTKLDKSMKRDLMLAVVGIDRLVKDAEPHYGSSPLASLSHPGNIPTDRFNLMPDWANIHQYCTMRLKSGIVV